ncbi:MAG: hypothetical protein HRT82_16095 [Henriciella sp.]|nr:hypothetical protein [Henriciella sp.]
MMTGDQIRLSIMMLLAVFLAWGGSSALARSTDVIANRVASEQARHVEIDGVFFYDGGYVDEGDMVLLDMIENADMSEGGVYFIGSSESVCSLMPWTLSAAERAQIHNFSIGDFRHREIEDYVRILVEDFNMLEAGGEKNTVVLSSFSLLARPKDLSRPIDAYVANLFERHGRYSYDWEDGIRYKNPGRLERIYRSEKDLANRFLTFTLTPPPSRVRPVASMEWRVQHTRSIFGEGWEETMDVEVQSFERTIDYLLERNVNVMILRPPNGSWHDGFPFEEAYWSRVEPLIAARDLPVLDFTEFLEDEEFGDDVHPRYSGQVKLHEAYRELAIAELAKSGVSLSSDTENGDLQP